MSSSHPSAQTLELFVHGGLEPAARERVEAHAERCPECERALALIRNADFAVTTGLVLERPVAPEAGAARPGHAARRWPRTWLPTRARVLRALDPSSRCLPVSGVVALVGVLVPALWLAT